ncbi:hypothetical protein GWL_12450 [Herbaspirillum sp. GW103]|nr:hypothetical protein GWL_12450 [Herbaspirillum sp. GW103]
MRNKSTDHSPVRRIPARPLTLALADILADNTSTVPVHFSK